MMTPTKTPLETVEQQLVVTWADHTLFQDPLLNKLYKVGLMLFAVPNGGSRARSKRVRGVSIEALRMKREGVRAGVPDLFLAIPVKHGDKVFHGLFIEMKRKRKTDSSVSEEQLAWQQRLQERGYASEICYGHQAAIDTIKAYLSLNQEQK